MDCPTCAAPTDEAADACPACGRALGRPATDSVLPRPFKDARKEERIILPTDVLLRKPGEGASPEKEERTVTHDLSRNGMRILTSWSDLETGDEVKVVEVGGDFSAGAIVRHVHRGADYITRIGIEFIENRAPDRLVAITKGGSPVPASERQAPAPPGSQGPASSPPTTQRFGSASSPASGTQRPVTGFRPPHVAQSPSSPFSTTVTQRPGSALLPSTGARTPPSSPTTAVPRFGAGLPAPTVIHNPTTFVSASAKKDSPPAEAAPGSSALQEEVNKARRLVGESKIWEALQSLDKAQQLAIGTPDAQLVQILILETQAKNPSMLRTAQRTLEELAREEPGNVRVLLALARVYRDAGLSARARTAYTRVLSLDSTNREAAAALAG